MISFFFRKNRLYLHQYLCINVVYSIFFLCVFFMTRKNINISHLFYTLIYAKAVPINSYLLCTSVYIVIVFLSATSLELLISYILSYMGTYLSLQSFKLTFIQKDNFRLKFLINYMLNYLIIVVLCLFLSCFIKIYIL